MTLDRQLALDDASASAVASANSADAEKKEKPASGLGGFFSALKTAAEDAGKQLDNGSNNENAPAKQTTLLTIINEVKTISNGPVPAAMFAPPADYREVKAREL